jgi:hypothetical protein
LEGPAVDDDASLLSPAEAVVGDLALLLAAPALLMLLLLLLVVVLLSFKDCDDDATTGVLNCSGDGSMSKWR